MDRGSINGDCFKAGDHQLCLPKVIFSYSLFKVPKLIFLNSRGLFFIKSDFLLKVPKVIVLELSKVVIPPQTTAVHDDCGILMTIIFLRITRSLTSPPLPPQQRLPFTVITFT